MATEMGRRVGENIKRRRLELGLKQRELAARFDSDAVNDQRISDWERGVNQPSGRYQDQLVTALEWEDAGSLYAAPADGTPDLMGALQDGAVDQLDRIEAVLLEIRAVLFGGDLSSGFEPPTDARSSRAESKPPRADPRQRRAGR